MYEARVILPNSGNDGKPLDGTHDTLQHVLCDEFGGYTAQPVTGGYKANNGRMMHENGTAYDVAMPDDAANIGKLIQIGRWAAFVADQECVYVRTPSGRVEFVEPAMAQIAA